MKQTALQELINELKEESSKLQPNQYSWHCLMTIIVMAQSKLPQEKQDLIKAYNKGFDDGCFGEGLFTGTNYFNQTFEI